MYRLNRFTRRTLALLALAALPATARAQSVYKIIHTFSGKAGGGYPSALLGYQSDPADPTTWALYGKTANGGDTSCVADNNSGCGVVFTLAQPPAGAGAWPETLLYVFHHAGIPTVDPTPLIATPSGTLCGTRDVAFLSTSPGPGSVGSAFCLTKPQPGQGYFWINHELTKEALSNPSGLVQDRQGTLYTAAVNGGSHVVGLNQQVLGNGSVAKLTLEAGLLKPSVILTLPGSSSSGSPLYGANPHGTLWRDARGVLYAASFYGGANESGTIFSLTPPAAGQTAWTPTLLHAFGASSDGKNPAPVIGDPSGALYGTTLYGGTYGEGTIYRLTPPVPPSTVWTETILYSFFGGADGAFPSAPLFRTASGALYGTASNGGNYGTSCPDSGCGVVFRLTPPTGGVNAWSFSVLHTFSGLPSDGGFPNNALTAGPDGTLYGTAQGGAANAGIAFSVAP